MIVNVLKLSEKEKIEKIRDFWQRIQRQEERALKIKTELAQVFLDLKNRAFGEVSFFFFVFTILGSEKVF
jgi:uncharacterized protein (UPF0335 family)